MAEERSIFGMSATWARRVLAGSLVLNFLAAGLIVGAAVNRGMEEPRRGSTSFITAQIVEITKEPRQAEVRAHLEAQREAFMNRRTQRFAAWMEIADRLEAQPFDEQALRDAFTGMRTGRETLRVEIHEALTQAMTMMSDDERVVLASKIRENVKRRAERKNR